MILPAKITLEFYFVSIDGVRLLADVTQPINHITLWDLRFLMRLFAFNALYSLISLLLKPLIVKLPHTIRHSRAYICVKHNSTYSTEGNISQQLRPLIMSATVYCWRHFTAHCSLQQSVVKWGRSVLQFYSHFRWILF